MQYGMVQLDIFGSRESIRKKQSVSQYGMTALDLILKTVQDQHKVISDFKE